MKKGSNKIMNKNTKILFILITILFVFTSCKNANNENNKKFVDVYKTKKKIKPLKEYTRNYSREWSHLSDEHIPQVSKIIDKGDTFLMIKVPLKKPSFEHYIEKIGIIDEKGKEIISKTLKRQKKPKTYVVFDINDIPQNKKLKVFAKCNLHDMWTASLNIEN